MKLSQVIAVSVLAIVTAAGFSSLASAPQKSAPTSTNFEVMETSIPEIHAAMKSGKVTAHALVQQYLYRIDVYDKKGPDLNCIVNLNPQALAEADKLDAEFKSTGKFRGSLHGIPILVKDEIDTAGMPTTLGSILFKDYRPPRDAFAIE